jgi:methyltransferase
MTLDMHIAYAVLAAVAGARLAELAVARRNTRRLLAQGGIEVGAAHYPLFILLHGAWLASLALTVDTATRVDLRLIALMGLLQLGRLWIILTLGRFWTTRIITLPAAPLIRRGPYRFLRHPNYVLVMVEIVVLPVALGAIWQALFFSVLNGLLLAHRIRVEAAALAPRQAIERGHRSCAAQPLRP